MQIEKQAIKFVTIVSKQPLVSRNGTPDTSWMEAK